MYKGTVCIPVDKIWLVFFEGKGFDICVHCLSCTCCTKDRYVLETSVADPWHFGVDPDPRIHASDKWIRIRMRIWILLFASLTFKTPKKINFFNFFCLLHFEGTFTTFFFKDKKSKRSHKTIGMKVFLAWW